MEKSKRAQRRKPETGQDGPEATAQLDPGGQGVHREMESEGHEEKYWAVIEGAIPTMNWSAKGRTRSRTGDSLCQCLAGDQLDRKSTRLNSSH